MVTLDDIRVARQRIGPHVHRTPLWRSRALSELLHRDVFLKAELLQKTGSFKPRGMLNKLHTLDEGQRRAGVITFSAGNAAQGLAYAAGILGIRATVVMPGHASPTKAQATREYGGEVILHGTAAECFDMCMRLVRERGLTFISSFDDETLMAGRGSIGHPPSHAIRNHFDRVPRRSWGTNPSRRESGVATAGGNRLVSPR
jgi:threonine dehydratase